MRFDKSGTEYRNTTTIADGAILAANRVTLINTAAGRIDGGVTFARGGAAFVNEAGGRVRAAPDDGYDVVLVKGSAGADTVTNAGTIEGRVALGGGDDTFVSRDGSSYGVDLGDGDDLFRVEGKQSSWQLVEGGAGIDTFIYENSSYYVSGGGVTGFEHLILADDGNIVDFSDYRSITLGAGEDLFFNFVDCENAALDLALAGQSVAFHNSSINDVIGSDGQESVEADRNARINGDVLLKGGDDYFSSFLYSNEEATIPTIGGIVDAGDGRDTLEISWITARDREFDLADYRNFEKLNLSTSYGIDEHPTTRVINAVGFTEVRIGDDASTTFASCSLGGAQLSWGYGGTIVLAKGVEIGSYGDPFGFDSPPDTRLSVTIVNKGAIAGEVRFSGGDDRYEGQAGSAGGQVLGQAGDDALFGGRGKEWLIGGEGNDLLSGGGGDDQLSGDQGSDVLIGGGGSDRLYGGGGADVFRFGTGDSRGKLPDFIGDFSRDEGDRISLKEIDANPETSGDDAFVFVGSAAFSGHAGEVRFAAQAGQTTIFADVDGDARADLIIDLAGEIKLVARDFVL